MEPLKHECGIAQVRLLKPLEYYKNKYGTETYGLEKLYLLMEKQHNRGQEGAGMSCVKLSTTPGNEYVFRERALGTNAITEIFNTAHEEIKKEGNPFLGEMYMGHLRYSTTGHSGISYVHPFLRRNNWRAKTLILCGNFNLTNIDDIFASLVETGQHPRNAGDTFILLEQMGHRLDKEVEYHYCDAKKEGLEGMGITDYIESHIDISNVLKKCAPMWDGGYAICGQTGSGESFCLRDPWGIRPAFYYADDEIVVVASERPIIQTVMNVQVEDVHELGRGSAITVSKNGKVSFTKIIEPKKLSSCSFERIYFSRGSDIDIYAERKNLGRNLVEPVLNAVDNDIVHTVFSFIPNTAEVAYMGMMDGFEDYLNNLKKREIEENIGNISSDMLDEILSVRIRMEKVAIKDIKLRTFIAEGATRNDMAAHVYDVTYGTVTPGVDNLVVIDDSIVRGTTLKQSIVRILDRLHPKKIVIVSSSPQVRYPDYYGIDMSSLSEFIAFKAAVALTLERKNELLLRKIYDQAVSQESEHPSVYVNFVKEIYAQFTDDEISAKIAELITDEEVNAKVELVYQTIDGLRKACPSSPGDWYFSGDYPTTGGMRWVNKAYISFYETLYKAK